MVEVFFAPQLLPRTTTREEWYRKWTDYRVMKRGCRLQNQVKEGLLRSKALSPAQRQRIIDELIYPPLYLGPGMDEATKRYNPDAH